jgi:rhodanese-related sulfurtransferase
VPTREVDAQTLVDWARSGGPVVDVRAISECLKGTVRGGHLLPFRRGQMARQAVAWWPSGAAVMLVAPDAEVARGAEGELMLAAVEVKGYYLGPVEQLEDLGLHLLRIEETDVHRLAAALERQEVRPRQVLDVREPQERAACRIEGSTWIPLGQLAGRAAELDPEGTWYAICASGVRSARAAALLHDRGFRRVLNVQGGMNDWLRSGLPVVGEAAPVAPPARGGTT